jgi:hypothetical protein
VLVGVEPRQHLFVGWTVFLPSADRRVVELGVQVEM